MDCGNLQTEHRTLSCRGPLAPACHAATSPKIVFSQVSLIQGDGICSPPVLLAFLNLKFQPFVPCTSADISWGGGEICVGFPSGHRWP